MAGDGIVMGIAAAVLLWSYLRAPARRSVTRPAAILKLIGFSALALSLVEPLLTGVKPRRGANASVILADNSQSMRVRDGPGVRTRRDWLKDRLNNEAVWE